jgi:hypothetical protein
LFPDFVPRQIYEYATVTKSLQLRVSLRFSAPRYGFYCTIWVKPYDILTMDQDLMFPLKWALRTGKKHIVLFKKPNEQGRHVKKGLPLTHVK